MASTIAIRVKIFIENIGSQLFRRFYVPDSFTIGDLIEYIDIQLSRESIQGEIYFMFNEYQTDMVDESRLGSILFPEDILLVRSMIENNSLLFVNGRITEPPSSSTSTASVVSTPTASVVSTPSSRQFTSSIASNSSFGTFAASASVSNSNVSTSTSISITSHSPLEFPPPLEDYSDDDEEEEEDDYEEQAIQNISQQLLSLMQGNAGSENTVEFNIHSNDQALELNSFLDVFSNLANLQPMPMPMPLAVAPPIVGASAGVINNTILTANLFSDLLTILQNPSVIPGNYQDVVVGLDKNDLDKQKIDTYSNFTDNTCDSCSICIDKFAQDDTCRELKCHHLFHKDCIDHWLEDNISCPICRTECGKGVPKV